MFHGGSTLTYGSLYSSSSSYKETTMKNFIGLAVTIFVLSCALAARAETPTAATLPPTTIEELNQLPFSGVLYTVIANHLLSTVATAESPRTLASVTTGLRGRGITASPDSFRFKASPEESVGTTINLD